MRTALFLLALTALVSADFLARAAAAPPNVVFLFIDDLGYGDLGPYGCSDIPTPNLDRLAAEGVTFTSCYVTNPPCCPSRCSMIMGQYGQRFGKYGMSRGLPIPEDLPTLAEFVRDAGYATGQIGKWDLGSKRQGPLTQGFDEVAKLPPAKRYTEEEIAELSPWARNRVLRQKGKSKYYCLREDGAEAWRTDYEGDLMVDFIERHKDEPFFLYFSPDAVHGFNAEAPESLMSRTTAKGKRRSLAGQIVSVDDQVGKLLEALDREGLRKDTLIIFSSDNGADPQEGGSSAPYRGGKGPGTQQEGWARVPTIFSFPGRLPEGSRYEGLTATFDYYSTIAKLIGQPVPEHCDGVDLFPILAAEKQDDAHEYLFWLNSDPTDPPHRHLVAARWKNWRLLEDKKTGQWRLFDLLSDPREEHDVAADHPEIAERLAAKHAEWAEGLVPLAEVPKVSSAGPIIPHGHGWAYAPE